MYTRMVNGLGQDKDDKNAKAQVAAMKLQKTRGKIKIFFGVVVIIMAMAILFYYLFFTNLHMEPSWIQEHEIDIEDHFP